MSEDHLKDSLYDGDDILKKFQDSENRYLKSAPSLYFVMNDDLTPVHIKRR